MRNNNDIKKQLLVLLACVFVVMIGFGITLSVLPFYVERLALVGEASRQAIVLHVGLLTGIYPLVQLIFAPLWGRWSDRIGRRPLVLIGIAGYVAAQVMFGLANSLWLLYAARVIGGMLSSATLPGRSCLCRRHDDGRRARSRDGVVRHGSESRRCCWTRARRNAVSQRLAF